MAKGPSDTKSYKICRYCDCVNYWMGMTHLYADCEHPDILKKMEESDKGFHNRIGNYERGSDGGIPTPDWCPEK